MKVASQESIEKIFLRIDNFKELSRILATCARLSALSMPVRSLAEKISADSGQNYQKKIILIENFLRSKFSFNRDPRNIEYLQSPAFLARKLLAGEKISGDCDDISCLFLSLA
ncbi:MAG: hypothetical protein ACREI9_16520, partial [Nitrospiraceae bacterium]